MGAGFSVAVGAAFAVAAGSPAPPLLAGARRRPTVVPADGAGPTFDAGLPPAAVLAPAAGPTFLPTTALPAALALRVMSPTMVGPGVDLSPLGFLQHHPMTAPRPIAPLAP